MGASSCATTPPSRPLSALPPRSRTRSITSTAELVAALVAHHADPIGHLIGVLSAARPRFRDGCFLYVSDRGLARLILSLRGYSAITFGHVIVAAGVPPEAIWRHELRHVHQYERIGCAFLPLYRLLYSRRGYSAHPLERDASRPTRLFE